MRIRTMLGRLIGAAALLGVLGGSATTQALTARGDFRAQVLTYSLPVAGETGTLLKLVVLVPAADLSWKSEGDSLHARLRLTWDLYALGENPVHVDELQHLTRSADKDAYSQSFFYARERILPAGEYRLELSCRDEGRKIGGLAGLFGRHPVSDLSTRVQVRQYGETGTLADPLLYTYLGEDAPARHNPGGVFSAGDSLIELRTSFVPPRRFESESTRYFSLVLGIVDGLGEIHFERKGGWRYEDEALPLNFHLPLAGLESGDYRLTLLLQGESVESTRFEIPFRLRSEIAVGPDELDRRAVEAQLFLDGEAYRLWTEMPGTDRVQMMQRFWKHHDPNPSTEENEVYDEFLRRYKIAQQRYTVFHPGALSDRGRILIRFGEPDEIQVEVMPMNRQALINAVRDLHGKEEIEPGASMSSPDPAEGEDEDAQDLNLRRDLSKIGVGNSVSFGNESEPFEVWTYELEGRPLLPQHRLQLHSVGLKLIFVDRGGYGDYELVYRSEDFDF